MNTYLYNRISSAKQATGDGLTRQSESTLLTDFIERHKLKVVQSMYHIGSSFTGKNFNNDSVLGKFIEDIRVNKISVPVCLTFENWDRFGRDLEWKNAKRFLDLINNGVSIGVVSMGLLIDQKLLGENPYILNLVINDIQRARTESQRKSGFSKRNIAVKIEQAKQGKKIYFGGVTPRWILGIEKDEWIIDKPMVGHIKRIFDLYLKGNSCNGIAKILNKEKLPNFGKSRFKHSTKAEWFNTLIKNLLSNKHLIGHAHINDFESKDYYPHIIDETTFYRVHTRLQVNTRNRGGSKTGKVANLFKGLAYCEKCGGDIVVRYYNYKGHTYSYTHCHKSKMGLCDEKVNWRSFDFEQVILLDILDKMNVSQVTPQRNDTLNALQTDLSKVKEQIDTTIKLIGRVALPQLETKLNDLQKQSESLQGKIIHEQSKQVMISNNPTMLAKLKNIYTSMGVRVTDNIPKMKGIDMTKVIPWIKQYIKDSKTGLRDHKVRAEIRNIIPELVSKVTYNLTEGIYTVEFHTGETRKQNIYYIINKTKVPIHQ